MIELHIIKEDEFSSKLEKRLDRLVVAHEKNTHQPGDIEKPYIKDGKRVLRTKEELENWFIKLENDLKWQRSLSGDGCYIDPETGNIC